MLVGQKGTSRAGNTLPSDKRPQVPDAVQPKEKKAIKKTPSCNRVVGYPRPAHSQATVMGKGEWTKSHDFFTRSDTSFSAWRQQQCRPVFVLFLFQLYVPHFQSSKCVPSPPKPGQASTRVTSSTPAIVNYIPTAVSSTHHCLRRYDTPKTAKAFTVSDLQWPRKLASRFFPFQPKKIHASNEREKPLRPPRPRG